MSDHLISSCPYVDSDVILAPFDEWAEENYPDMIEDTDVFFEHGQWFARITFVEGYDDDQADFSVVDAQDGKGNDYLDFERLS